MKLLICLAFHYVEGNLPFLKKVLNNILDNYQYETKIIVDTNCITTQEKLIQQYPTVCFHVVTDLPHPYMLTSVHRKHMVEEMNNFDLVIYSEDDILIPFQCILDFMQKISTMWPTYIPCYRRLEWSHISNNYVPIPVDVDGPQIVNENDIIIHEGVEYFIPDRPYQAFWMLPTKLLREVLDMDRFQMCTIYREHAASYTLGPPPYHNYNANIHNHPEFLNKIPLFEIEKNANGERTISQKCFIYHTPNKYVDVYNPENQISIDKYLHVKKSSLINME